MPQPSHELAARRRLRIAINSGVAVAVVLCIVALVLLWFRGGPPPKPDYGGRPVLRVLFIGNSLTTSNNLPGMVKTMSIVSETGPVIEAIGRAIPGTHLGDHLLAGADVLIQEGAWDFVVLQQGPSSLPKSREQLLEFARAYEPLIRAAGAEPAFYMVWPEEAHIGSADRVRESYLLAALEIDALLLPAGEAWRFAWREDETLPLYSADRFHPSPAGTYLAALVICSGLTGVSALELPGPQDLGLVTQLSPEEVQTLKRAAARSLEQPGSPEPGLSVP